MFAKIVGTIFILLGVLFFLYPELLRGSLRRKAVRKLRGYLFAAFVFFGALLISTGWRYDGLLAKVLTLLGIVALIKGLLFLNSTATEKITAWILERPKTHLQMFAAGQIVLGLLILFGLRG